MASPDRSRPPGAGAALCQHAVHEHDASSQPTRGEMIDHIAVTSPGSVLDVAPGPPVLHGQMTDRTKTGVNAIASGLALVRVELVTCRTSSSVRARADCLSQTTRGDATRVRLGDRRRCARPRRAEGPPVARGHPECSAGGGGSYRPPRCCRSRHRRRGSGRRGLIVFGHFGLERGVRGDRAR